MEKLLSFVLLLFTSIGFSTSQEKGFWSINCGGTNYTDEFGISWTGDEKFLLTGETRIGTNGNSSTFRVFTSQRVRKSCYSIPVGKGVGKGKNILLRMTFDDGQANNPPDFDIMFDGNMVEKPKNIMNDTKSIEVIYIARWEDTKICLGRTKSEQDPFVSKIEIRTLREDMYDVALYKLTLRLLSRFALGADRPIRYKDDEYDRIWTNRTLLDYTVVKSNITDFTPNMTENVPNHVPALLLASGIEPAVMDPANPNLTIPLDYLPSDDVDIYHIMYFTAMSYTQNTTFSIYYNGIDGQLNLKYGNLTSLSMYIRGNNTSTVVLVPAANSTDNFHPIISAMETYTYNAASEYDATEEDDVKSLFKLQENFQMILGEWNGDPCLPVNYTWEWIGCAYFTTPFVSLLNLSGYGLSGEIPDFRDLKSLMYIDLSNNSLSGEIPDFLANFNDLKYLNLANNDFVGKIPTALSLKNESVEQIYKGNPKLSNQTPNGVVYNFILYLILTSVLCFIIF